MHTQPHKLTKRLFTPAAKKSVEIMEEIATKQNYRVTIDDTLGDTTIVDIQSKKGYTPIQLIRRKRIRRFDIGACSASYTPYSCQKENPSHEQTFAKYTPLNWEIAPTDNY